jgi:class 3 adenylate cyclase/tetratricopeptide (TPR) repeat protein
MNQTLEEQITQLKQTIAEMEAQRPTLGDEVVDAALAPLRAKLDELAALLQAQLAQPPSEPALQRKLVSLLFMDIAGSTAIAQHMDPEDVRELFDIALKKLAVPVESHSGHVTRFMGDGFLAVFGAPTAREHDPEQAIRAGLEIISTARDLAPELKNEWHIADFQVRVGINTGLVALGGLTEAQDTLMGAAVNLAARLESAAPPGGLLISHDTYRHVRGLFDVEFQEPIQAKGFDQPVPVYRVLHLKPRAFRTHTRGVEGVETPMIGRQNELTYLQDALLAAIEESEGQLITITGEAGMGKSRLLYEFQNWVEPLPPPPVRFFEGRGRQEAQGLPYDLLRGMFEFRYQIQDDDPAEVARQKMVDGLMAVFGSEQEGEMRAHLISQMLGFDFSLSPHLRGVLGDAEQLRNRGRSYLAEFFETLSSQALVLVFLEDIHWADDSSLDTFSWLGERLSRLPMLVVCAARPTLFERRPYWGEGLDYHRRVDLEPLSRRESRQLVAEIFRLADHLPDELRDLVVEGAEGNPFYLEELVKMLVEDGVIVKGEQTWQVHPQRLAQVEVPPTLAGVLQARLDSLSLEERTVLQQASVVGRQFWDRVVAHIQAAGGGSPQLVPEMLSTLRTKEMIYRREGSTFSGSREFSFKHDILREVTYESVLKRLRRSYHSLVADWLINQDHLHSGEHNGLIAGHLLQANRNEQAGEFFLQAGQAALDTYANVEAESHFRKALGLALNAPHRAVCLEGLGKALERQGKADEAVLILRNAIELNQEIGELDNVGKLYADLSRLHWHVSLQISWETCLEGLNRLEGDHNGAGIARLLAEAGRIAYFKGQPPEEIIDLCQRAILMADHFRDLETNADAMITLALLELKTNQSQRSITILEEVIDLAETNLLLRTAFRAHGNLGVAYLDTLDIPGSNWHTSRAIDIGKQINRNYIFTVSNLVEGFIRLGKLNDAERLLVDEIPQVDAASSAEKEYNKILGQGRIQYARGHWDMALENQQRFLDSAIYEGSIQNITHRNIEIASLILELDRFKSTRKHTRAETGLRKNLELGARVYESCCLISILSSRYERFQDARIWIEKAWEVPRKSMAYIDYISQESAEFELAYAQGHWIEAVLVAESYLELLRDHGYRWGWARRLIDLGDALVGRGQPGDRERAEMDYQQSLEMFSDMGATGYVEVLNQRLTALAK